MSPLKKDRAGLHVKLLGGFETRLATGQPVTLPTRKAQALLAYLATRPGQAHARNKLAALLWADRGDVQARDSLRHTLVQLRKALPAPASLITERRAVVLDTARIEVDVARFEARAAAGSAEDLAEAAEIYQGDFLEGFVLREPLFEEWLMSERERLRELAVGTLGQLLEQQRAACNAEPAIQTALRLLALDAAQERAHRALMQLYVQQGRRAAALRQYQACVGILRRELGTEPEAETRQLYQEIVRRRDDVQRGGARGVVRPGTTRSLVAPMRPVAVRPAPGFVETPLIGRSTELATLCTAFDEARWGHGRMVAIVGEAGIGKTRLVAELARTAAEHDTRVLTAQCYESEQILPFGPWVEALRAGQVVPDDPALLALEPAWRAELARLFPEIAAADLPAPTDNARRLFESIAQVIRSLATAQPVLVVLEDVHWADEMTVRLAAFLGRRITVDRVLVAMTAREEDLVEADALRRALAELRGAGHFAELVLSPLSRPDTASLVRCLIAAGSESQEVARVEEQAWAASAGNPFVVVETVRALREGLTLQTVPNLSLPQRVREVIAGRVERVSDRSRQLLSVAAVIGRAFDFALLQGASGLTDHAAAEGVEELVRRRLLHTVSDGFDFTHDRIREVVYGGLLPPRRTLLHERIVEAIERLHGDRLTEHVEQLAHHAVRSGVWDRTLLHERRRRLHAPIVETIERLCLHHPAEEIERLAHHAFTGEVWDKAFTYCYGAGCKAAARSANRLAVACFERSLVALSHLPESAEAIGKSIDVRIELRYSLLALAELQRMFDHLQEAERLAASHGDQPRLGRVSAFIAEYFWVLGDYGRAIESGLRASGIATAVGDVALQALTNRGLCYSYHALGDYRRAIGLWRDRGVHGMGDNTWLLWCLAELGDFAEGIAAAEEDMRVAEASADRYDSAVAAAFALGILHLRRGHPAQAIASLERGVKLCQENDLPIWFGLVASALGYAYGLAGRVREAVPLLERAVDSDVSLKIIGGLSLLVTWLGEAYLQGGRPVEALDCALRALRLSQQHKERGNHAYALQLLGEIGSRRDPPDREAAETNYGQALALAAELGMRPLVAHCHLGLGKLYRRTKQQEAQEHLATATTMYREMDMQFWLEQAEAELRRP